MKFSGLLIASALVVGAHAAQADSRVFIIANQADGYGVDQCLANGDKCGAPVARAYCQSRDFTAATAFRRVDRDEITGAIPADVSKCSGPRCSDFIAITCQR